MQTIEGARPKQDSKYKPTCWYVILRAVAFGVKVVSAERDSFRFHAYSLACFDVLNGRVCAAPYRRKTPHNKASSRGLQLLHSRIRKTIIGTIVSYSIINI